MEWEDKHPKATMINPIRIYGNGWITHQYHGHKAYCFLKPDILAWVKTHPSDMYTLVPVDKEAKEKYWIEGDLYFLSEELEAWLLLRWL